MNIVEGARGREARRQDHRRPPRAHRASRPPRATGKGTVGVAEHLGSDTFLHVHADELGTINVRADGEVPVSHGDTVYLTPDPSKIHRFDAAGLAI